MFWDCWHFWKTSFTHIVSHSCVFKNNLASLPAPNIALLCKCDFSYCLKCTWTFLKFCTLLISYCYFLGVIQDSGVLECQHVTSMLHFLRWARKETVLHRLTVRNRDAGGCAPSAAAGAHRRRPCATSLYVLGACRSGCGCLFSGTFAWSRK